MCCSVLQCVAVCCSVLQCVAVCCSVLQRVAVCCKKKNDGKASHSSATHFFCLVTGLQFGVLGLKVGVQVLEFMLVVELIFEAANRTKFPEANFQGNLDKSKYGFVLNCLFL